MRNIHVTSQRIGLLHRFQWAIWFVIIIGCMISSLWSTLSTHAEPQIESRVNIDIILLVDNSTSMTKTDPDEMRIRAAQFLLDYLRVNANTQHANYRVGLANFGGRGGGDGGDTVYLRLLQDDTIRDSLHVQTVNGEGTDFAGALTFAFNELHQTDPQTKKVVVLLTDGQLQPLRDDKTPSPEELRQSFKDLEPTVRDLKKLGADIFVLDVSNTPQNSDQWKNLIDDKARDGGVQKYYQIISDDEFNDNFNSFLSNFIGIHLDQISGRKLEPNLSVKLPVEPLLDQLIFSFIKSNPAIIITLIDPNGKKIPLIREGDSGKYDQFYNILNPQNGSWHIQYEGVGSVKYWIVRREPQVTVYPEATYPYSGQPITVTARLMRNNTIVTPTQNIRMDALITTPDSQSVTLKLTPDTSGAYIGVFTDTRTSGAYTVSAKVIIDEQTINVQCTPASISLMSAPLPPTPGWLSLLLSPLGIIVVVITTMIPVVVIIYLLRALRVKAKRPEPVVPEEPVSLDPAKTDDTAGGSQLEVRIDEARNHANSDPSKAITIVSSVFNDIFTSIHKTEKDIIEMLEKALNIFDTSMSQMITKGSLLEFDENNVQMFKAWVSRNAQRSGDTFDTVIGRLFQILRSSSVGSPNSQETTKKNLQLIKISHSDIIWSQNSHYFPVNTDAIKMLEDIAGKLYHLIDIKEKDSAKQPESLKGIAIWFSKHHSQDMANYHDYLRKLSQFPLHQITCPTLTSVFWKSLQIDPQQDHDHHFMRKFQTAFGTQTTLRKRISLSTKKKHINTFLAEVVEKLREPDRSVLKIICKRWHEEIEHCISSNQRDRAKLSLAPELIFLHRNGLQKILTDWTNHVRNKPETLNPLPQGIVGAFDKWFRMEHYRHVLDNWWNNIPKNLQREAEIIFKHCELHSPQSRKWILNDDILKKIGKKCDINVCGNTHSLCPKLESLSEEGILFKDLSDTWCVPTQFKEWWNERHERIKVAVGRIEISEGKAIGTGVYVGNNLLLTSYHVVEEIRTNGNQSYVHFDSQSQELELKRYPLRSVEILNPLDSKRISVTHKLDYALITIVVPSHEQINIPRVSINGTWDPVEGDSVTIIHYPGGESLQVDNGKYIGLADKGRINFQLSTNNGSSGAPIFNNEGQLIALHEGTKAFQFSVPIRSFWSMINEYLPPQEV